MEISDNNNTNEKNKNGCVSPDLDQHTLYSQGEFKFPHSSQQLFRHGSVQMDRV